MTEADYVVVGAGSAGCALARRLAESGASVVLIEAGRADKSRLVKVPGLVSAIHTVPQIKDRFDWGFKTEPQKFAWDRKIPSTRGKVLGGSSSINGMLFVRGNRKNFDDWAAEGATGWGYEDVLPYFKRLENWEDGASSVRGSGGPIEVTRQKDLLSSSRMFIDAMVDTLGVPFNADYNGEEQEGAGVFQASHKGGLRYSTARGYLHAQDLPNLKVMIKTLVTKVLIEGDKATGVEIVDKAGRRAIRARNEVILSGGVFNSPQLLMLSGVGPAAHLREVGIDVRADLPVGQNLHDHLFVPCGYVMKGGCHKSTGAHFGAGMVANQWDKENWFGRTVFEAVGFVRTSFATDIPDLQIHSLPWSYPGPNQDARKIHIPDDKRPQLTVLPTLIYPKSRGEVRLRSADPTAAPIIDPQYLSEPEDADVLIEGIQMIRDIMRSKAIASEVIEEVNPGPKLMDETALRGELGNRIHTVYHGVGTCRMGVDERAVVDPKLKVLGIEGLRVADASIMPSITGGNTNAPAIMIGERAADLILRG